jgi:hypothetical protein
VQLPLPRHIHTERVLLAVHPDKDVDGFHPMNVGRLGSIAPGLPLDFPVPCTPLGCSMLLADAVGPLTGRTAVVVGRSTLVGRPVAQLLLRADCTVTIAHSRTRDLPGVCRGADILVVAIGKPEFVRGDWIKPGAAVIDVASIASPRDGKTKLVATSPSRRRPGRGPHAGAGRRRPDDRGLPDVQHAAGSARSPAVRARPLRQRAQATSSSASPGPAPSRCGASSPRRSGRDRPVSDSASL